MIFCCDAAIVDVNVDIWYQCECGNRGEGCAVGFVQHWLGDEYESYSLEKQKSTTCISANNTWYRRLLKTYEHIYMYKF